jgi:hypothetical protein
MPEIHDTPGDELRLAGSDPAAPAVEALRALAARPAPEPGAELAAFLADPAGSGESPEPRSGPVTVVRLRVRHAGRVAVAAGAALAIAALGGAALAATGGLHTDQTAQVQQDEPSDTSTTSADDQTAATGTSDPGETEADESETTDTETEADTGETGGTGAPAAPNATASANHHDGKGADDQHADVHGGGVVDHRAEHSPTTHPTGAPAVHPTGSRTHGSGASHHSGH